MEKTALLKRFVALTLSALLLSSCGTGNIPESERQIVSESTGNSSSFAVISAYRASAAAQVQVTDTSADLEYYPAVSYSDFDLDVSTDGAVEITLDGNGASFDSEEVTIADGVLTISAAGNYLLKGSFAGQIRVEAEKEDNVHLFFDGLTVESSMAPVCIVSAKNAAITLLEGTENTVTDGSDYTFADGEDEPDAALYSKTDLTINGTGALKVNGNYKNGIVSKDDLKIVGGTIIVNAVYNGIKGKDSLTVGGGVVNVTAGNDALKASNDEDPSRGWVVIEDGELRIEAGDDAIHAETWLIVTSGNIRIEQSYEGLEGKRIEIYGGDIDVVSSDDAVNAASGSASGEEFGIPDEMGGGINGQMPEGMTPPDGFSGERPEGMEPPDGFNGERPEGMTPPNDFNGEMPEGMTPPKGFRGEMPEGMTPPDDFAGQMQEDINTDPSFAREESIKQGDFGHGGMMSEEPEEGVYILIAGGSLRVQGGNDVIDSNGTFEQTGGVIVTVGPSMTVYGEPDGVVDTNGTMALTAGTFVSFCRSAGNSLSTVISHPAVITSLNGSETAILLDEAGGELLSVPNGTRASLVLVVSDRMTAGEEYVLRTDDTARAFTAEEGVQNLR